MTNNAIDINNSLDDSNDHYLETVTDLGEVEEVVAAEDVYSQSGALLIKQGAKINKKSYNALVKHKLKDSIDNIVSVGNAVTNHELALDFYAQLEAFDLFKQLQSSVPNPERFKNCLRQVDLNTAMRTKVSMAKKTDTELYEHSLRVAIGSVIIGMFMHLNDEDCGILAAAGLFHDLGKLHIDPALFATEKTFSAKELQFVYAHPVIMYQQLIAIDAYPKEIALAILEHHERIGGNGYPRGTNDYSNPYSAILAVTEVLISMTESHPLDRVMVALKTNHSKFDKAVMNALFKVLITKDMQLDEIEKKQQDLSTIEALLKDRMKHWREIEPEVEKCSSISLMNKLYTRMFEFRQSTRSWGIDIEDENLLSHCGDEPEAISELVMLLEEALYMMRDIGREFHRDITEKDQNSISEAITEWVKCTTESINDYSNKSLQVEVA